MNQGGNYWTLFAPGIWKVLHAVFQIGPINLGMKQMGARNAGNPHVACDVEGAGNVERSGHLGRPARQSSTLPERARGCDAPRYSPICGLTTTSVMRVPRSDGIWVSIMRYVRIPPLTRELRLTSTSILYRTRWQHEFHHHHRAVAPFGLRPPCATAR
jgi:hypothetical protein